MTPNDNLRKAPWWFTALVIAAAVPAFATPYLLAALPADQSLLRMYAMLYPVAVLASGYYAWVSYGTRRPLAWIMLVFMLLISACVFYLTWAAE